MDNLVDQETSELARLNKRLERERRARMEAEVIAEKALRDLYEQQRALTREIEQRERLEQQYYQAQKMEAVGRLASGVAHDFNNLLTVILGFSDLLKSTLASDDANREILQQIISAGDRATELTRQLLAFSRKQVLNPIVLDLNGAVAELQKMLRRLIGEDIELSILLQPGIPSILVDRGQLEQVIMNLAVNARDAMPGGGKLSIETGFVVIGPELPDARPEMPPGTYATLAVKDSGHGMDETVRSKIFEPFFTTKEAGKGTGLGLATVYGIVKQSGAFIYVFSEPGQGATFKIYFPQSSAAQAALPAATDPAADCLRGTETVLLVEDDEAICSLAQRVLRQKGYTILTAGTGADAIALCDQHPAPIQLLVIDLVLPGMSGQQLSEYLLSLRPEMRVLFISGHTEDAIVRQGDLPSESNFLGKPFTQDALARKIREVFAR